MIDWNLKGIKLSLPYVKIIRDKTCKYLVNRRPNQETIVKKDLTTNTDTSIISFFNEGVLINKEQLQACLSTKTYESLCYNLLTISDLITDDINTPEVKNIVTCMNKMIPTDFKYELSDIKFIALYLKQDDKSYTIDLFKNNVNY
jgi:hypothetical protein